MTYLREIIEEVSTDPSPLSQGGNVHPLTSHVLAFMEGLFTYEDTATIIASLYIDQDQRKNGRMIDSRCYLFSQDQVTVDQQERKKVSMIWERILVGIHLSLDRIETFA